MICELITDDHLLRATSVALATRRNAALHKDAIEQVKAEMKKVLHDIQSGKFTLDWVLENRAGQTSFKTMRGRAEEHPIEEVGQRLRDMMPWITEKALVDRDRN